jgi:hypothetical protein
MAEATPKADAVTGSQPIKIDSDARRRRTNLEADRAVKAELAKEAVAPQCRSGHSAHYPSSATGTSVICDRTPDPLSPQAAAERALDASAAKARSDARENVTAERQQAEASATGQSPAPAAGAMAKRARADAQSNEAVTPEQWIQRIERLRKDGKHTEAEASLAEFRKRYPGYKLPDTFK